MTEYCIKYSLATGLELARFSGPEGISQAQFMAVNEAIILVSASSFGLPLADLSIAEIRSAIWDRIKARRDAMIDGGAPTPSGAVDSYLEARMNIAGAVQAATIAQASAQAFTVNWTLLDNSVVVLDAAAMIAVGLAVLAHVNACHDRARALRDQINAAEDIASLLTIDIASGWPA